MWLNGLCVEPGMSLVGFTDILFVLGELNAFFHHFETESPAQAGLKLSMQLITSNS